MKTCLITTAQPVDYSRFYHREAATLANHGWTVALIGLASSDPNPAIPGIELLPTELKRGIGKPLRLGSVRQLAEQTRADIYHCLDPWAFRVGIGIKRRRNNVKVVYDSTELFPAVYQDRVDLAWPVRLIASAAVHRLERIAAREADAIIETNATRAQRFCIMGRNPVLVQNYPPRPARPLPERTRTARIAWTGMMSYNRGFDVLLRAFQEIATEFAAMSLTVFGQFDRRTDIEHWARHFVRDNKLADRVEFRDWLSYPELLAELERCDIGVILLQPGRRNDYTGQPNKLFEFMAAGLPVVASGFPEIGPVLRQDDCGVEVDPTKPDAVAGALRMLLADPNRATRLGRQGRKAVEREYNWDSAAARLLNLYNRLAVSEEPGQPGRQ